MGDLDRRYSRSNASNGIERLHFESGKAECRAVKVDVGNRTKSDESFLPNSIDDIPKFAPYSLLADLGSKPFTTYWKNLESLLLPVDQLFRFGAAIRADLKAENCREGRRRS